MLFDAHGRHKRHFEKPENVRQLRRICVLVTSEYSGTSCLEKLLQLPNHLGLKSIFFLHLFTANNLLQFHQNSCNLRPCIALLRENRRHYPYLTQCRFPIFLRSVHQRGHHSMQTDALLVVLKKIACASPSARRVLETRTFDCTLHWWSARSEKRRTQESLDAKTSGFCWPRLEDHVGSNSATVKPSNQNKNIPGVFLTNICHCRCSVIAN